MSGMADETIPIFRVADASRSVAWFEQLGFEQEWLHRFEPALPAFVSLARGAARMFLSEHGEDAGGPLVVGAVAYLRVDAVDPIAERFGVDVIEQPWAREVHLTDPDGNRLRVGERRT